MIQPPPPIKYGVADPQLAERLIVSNEYAMQEKVDGVRLVVLINEDGIFGYNKRGEQASIAPWLNKELSMLPDLPWAFDGEFTGDAYHIFDLMDAPVAGLTDKPFSERMKILTILVTNWMEDSKRPDSIRVVDTWLEPRDKLRGLLKLSLTKAEGAVFRPQNESAHFRGQVYKYKFRNTVDAVVVANVKGSASIEVGLYRDNDLVPIGKCAIHSPVTPGSVVEISYRKVSATGKLIEPVMSRVRGDKLAYHCTWGQLEEGKHLQDSVLIDSQAATIGEALGMNPEELRQFNQTL